MSKTSHASNGALREHHGALEDTEFQAVTGGKATPKLYEAAVKGTVFKKVEIHGTP